MRVKMLSTAYEDEEEEEDGKMYEKISQIER